MTIRLGSTILAGVATDTKVNAHGLFDFKWSDHILNEMSWIRSDTFSWQSGAIYTACYNHLAADISAATQSTETIEGITITVYTATDGHKVVLADQEANVSAIYNATGVAWYYIIDTANTRFKLPRTQYGFNGIRDTVGEYINPGVPNIVGTWDYPYSTYSASGTVTGAFEAKRSIYGEGATGGYYQGWAIDFSASRSNPIYGSSNTVQPSATQMYLYFYVGEFSQSATEQTAGITTEQLNGKVDVASLSECNVIIESYQNGTEWYRLYDDGWVEQGGMTTNTTVTYLVPMKDTNYNLMMTYRVLGTSSRYGYDHPQSISTTGFVAAGTDFTSNGGYWQVKGYSA